MKENPRKVSKSAIKSENALNEKEDFIMLPTVDFCFKELMQNERIKIQSRKKYLNTNNIIRYNKCYNYIYH